MFLLPIESVSFRQAEDATVSTYNASFYVLYLQHNGIGAQYKNGAYKAAAAKHSYILRRPLI